MHLPLLTVASACFTSHGPFSKRSAGGYGHDILFCIRDTNIICSQCFFMVTYCHALNNFHPRNVKSCTRKTIVNVGSSLHMMELSAYVEYQQPAKAISGLSLSSMYVCVFFFWSRCMCLTCKIFHYIDRKKIIIQSGMHFWHRFVKLIALSNLEQLFCFHFLSANFHLNPEISGMMFIDPEYILMKIYIKNLMHKITLNSHLFKQLT